MSIKKLKKALFKFKPFSKRQKQVLTWWCDNSPVKDKDGIICDGSIRAGKTIVMSLSYVMWAMHRFDGKNFGMAGKTIGSFRRNVLFYLKIMLKARGYAVKDNRSDNMLMISKNGKTNYFYIFGGKDERSQDLIQGITLAGIFLDEVALMPESFVNQATGRCSETGSKYWFNCNPEGPYHWFKSNWIDKKDEKNLVRLHFMMDDNLSLTEETKKRYMRMYSGIFFKRYILGLWVAAEGIIYDMFNEEEHVVDLDKDVKYDDYFLSMDYGTQNPTAMVLFGVKYENYQAKYYILKEYYHSGRETNRQKTNSEYYSDLVKFVGDVPISTIYLDPSAASFKAEIIKNGKFSATPANNDVLEGIRTVSDKLSNDFLKIDSSCVNIKKEFASYMWDSKAAKRGEDKPIQEHDHAMDAIRYGIYTRETKARPRIRNL